MKSRIRRAAGFRIACLIAVIFLFPACIGNSRPTNFYTLNPISGVQPVNTGQIHILGVGPINLPAYLDRPEVVTRHGTNSATINDFSQWIGPLKDNVSSVLIENLSTLLTPERIMRFPWRQSTPVSRQIRVNIYRFDTEKDQAILISDWWTGNPRQPDQGTYKRTAIRVPLTDDSIAARVAGMNQALDELSIKIASSIAQADRL